MSYVKNKIVQDEDLEIALAPTTVKFFLNKIQVGATLGQMLGITQYNQDSEYGWLSKFNVSGTVSKYIYIPQSETSFIESLSRNIKVNQGKANSSNDPVEIRNAEYKVETYENVLNAISKNHESVGLIISIFFANTTQEEELKSETMKVIDVITASKCRARVAATLQKQAFQTLSPYWTFQKEISELFGRVALLSSFFGGLPFSTNGFSDGKGYYFARDFAGGLIILDTWKRGGNRTNSNWTILGAPGTGKSTCIKHIILNEYAMGTKILIIDPENEYGEITKNLYGKEINAGGGKEGIINPLQIRPAPEENEDGEERIRKDNNGAMALHLKTLEVFFKLYLENATDIQLSILLKTIEELYNTFDIFWDTNVKFINNNEFPIINDLYELLLRKSKQQEPNLRAFQDNEYENLALLIRGMAIGADSSIFNGYTSLESNTEITCLNTFSLQNTSDRIRRTQYYNILTWCWEQMSYDRNEKIMLFIDEAYLMIDPNIPESLLYLRNIAKRCRKYGGGIVVASQSLIDFLDPRIKMYGTALLNLADYKVLYGSSGNDVSDTVDTFNLKEAHGDVLRKNLRGVGLLVMSSLIMQFDQIIPEHEWKYIGVRGGR